jgi:hypothetical protein
VDACSRLTRAPLQRLQNLTIGLHLHCCRHLTVVVQHLVHRAAAAEATWVAIQGQVVACSSALAR